MNNEPILSILVITHNQRDLLKRCLDSVLGQKLNVPFEVIVSDDRSDDGTAEFMAELQEKFSNGKLQIANLVDLVYTRCNSNDCDPKNVSERCGWNKLNAWRSAKGKYMVNIDADDYLLHDDIYQLQIDLLDAHPKCSMCQQYVLQVNEGAEPSTGFKWPNTPKMRQGEIISEEDVIVGELRGLNQTYMMRRQPQDNMAALYGKHYDDTVITYHHLQYGPVVFLDRADYVWVQYPKSISHNMTKDDQTIVYGLLPLFHADIIPALRYQFLRYGLSELIHLFKIAPKNPKMSEQYLAYLKGCEGFIYAYFAKPPSMFAQMRFLTIRIYMLLLMKIGLKSRIWFEILYKVLKK